jgi:hypothetical protein
MPAAFKASPVFCNSNNDPSHHFAGARNPITSGKGRIQMVKDVLGIATHLDSMV